MRIYCEVSLFHIPGTEYILSMIQWHCPVCLFDLLPLYDDHSYENSSLSDVSLCGQSVHLESVME